MSIEVKNGHVYVTAEERKDAFGSYCLMIDVEEIISALHYVRPDTFIEQIKNIFGKREDKHEQS